MSLTLRFRGLCTFIWREAEKEYDVVLPQEHGHQPVLIALSDYIDPFKTTWRPDFIGHVGKDQISVWLLGDRHMTLGTGSEKVMRLKAKPDDGVLAFVTYNAGLTPTDRAKILSDSTAGVVTLSHGAGKPARELDFTVKQKGKQDKPRKIATEIEWSGLPDILRYAKAYEIYFTEEKGQPQATVSNVAAVPSSTPGRPVDHVHLHYEFLGLKDDPIELVTGAHAPAAVRVEEVWDCVPPGEGP